MATQREHRGTVQGPISVGSIFSHGEWYIPKKRTHHSYALPSVKIIPTTRAIATVHKLTGINRLTDPSPIGDLMPVLEELSVSAPPHSTISRVADVSDDIAVSISTDNTRVIQVSDNPRATSSPSVSIKTVRAMKLEAPPEHGGWGIISKEWYSNGLIGV